MCLGDESSGSTATKIKKDSDETEISSTYVCNEAY